MVRILSFKSGGLRFNSRMAPRLFLLSIFWSFVALCWIHCHIHCHIHKFNSVSNNEFNNGHSTYLSNSSPISCMYKLQSNQLQAICLSVEQSLWASFLLMTFDKVAHAHVTCQRQFQRSIRWLSCQVTEQQEIRGEMMKCIYLVFL